MVGRSSKQYASDACRKRKNRQAADLRQPPLPWASCGVFNALRDEFVALGVVGKPEARVALGLAAQLDSGRHLGAQYVSLSRELDRRIDALRLRAERPDDPVVRIQRELAAHRLRLVNGGES